MNLKLNFYNKIINLLYNTDGELNLLAKIILSAITILIIKIAVSMLTKAFDKFLIKKGTSIDGRQITVTKLLNNGIKYVVYFICIVIVLDIFGVKTDRILATAGIGGVAIGFGAQFIIRDVISGLAIILENQIKVGDEVIINSIQGNVLEIGLRLTKIKGFDGAIHYISNGTINSITNMSKIDQRITVQMDVPLRYKLSEYRQIIDEISDELISENNDISEKPELVGISKKGLNYMTLTIWGYCKPGAQYAYEREILKKFIEKSEIMNMDLDCHFKMEDINEI